MVKKLAVRLYEGMLSFFDVVTVLTLAFEMGIITANVILRYIFHSPLAWLDEFAGFGLIWLGFVLSVRLMDEDDHFHVDVFTRRITSKLKLKLIYFFNYALMGCYCFLLGYYGFELCYRLAFVSPSYTLSVDWFPKSIIYIIIPIASFATIPVLIKKSIERKKMD